MYSRELALDYSMAIQELILLFIMLTRAHQFTRSFSSTKRAQIGSMNYISLHGARGIHLQFPELVKKISTCFLLDTRTSRALTWPLFSKSSPQGSTLNLMY